MGVSATGIVLFGLAILLTFLLLLAALWVNSRYLSKGTSPSPYSGLPLRRGEDLSYYSMERILRYLYQQNEYNNRIFDLRSSAVCRETGRIFPNSITWMDTIRVDWDFLQKRRPGQYVSWGSLTKDQQEYVKEIHGTLEGFQVELSSPNPLPRAVEPKYALAKPGPLYVDIDNYVLMGWKIVPGTDLEVLIIQWPSQQKPTHFTPLEDEYL